MESGRCGSFVTEFKKLICLRNPIVNLVYYDTCVSMNVKHMRLNKLDAKNVPYELNIATVKAEPLWSSGWIQIGLPT